MKMCNALRSEPTATSPHAFESVTAIPPPKSDLSLTDLSAMANSLPNAAERMMQSRMGLHSIGDPFGESICRSCGHHFRRGAQMSPKCPSCGLINM